MFAKRKTACLIALVAVLSLPAVASAAQWGRRGDAGDEEWREQRRAQRMAPSREEVVDGQRPQRLSPEERRQLRRDIRDAGREIYPVRR